MRWKIRAALILYSNRLEIQKCHSLRHSFDFSSVILQIDKELNIFDSESILHCTRTKRIITFWVFIALFLFIVLLGKWILLIPNYRKLSTNLTMLVNLVSDFYFWIQIAQELQSRKGNVGHNFYINVFSLIPFYCIYTAFVPLQAKFAVTIYRIGLRYRSLNRIISNYAISGEIRFHLNFWKMNSNHPSNLNLNPKISF